jgi:hypothetical protein
VYLQRLAVAPLLDEDEGLASLMKSVQVAAILCVCRGYRHLERAPHRIAVLG